jgi:hypothetical protein
MQEDDRSKKGLIVIAKAIAEASDEVRMRQFCHSLCKRVMRELSTFKALMRPVGKVGR